MVQNKLHIHQRLSSVNIFEIGENKILIEGRLSDERFFKSFSYTVQDSIKPGIVHDLKVRIILSLPNLIIEHAEAEMTTVPIEMCREIESTFCNLTGLRIGRGFRDKVKEIFGGAKGCVHMLNLILFMSSAAIQGYYSYYNRVQENGILVQSNNDDSLIVDSCHIWRKDGPLASYLEEIRATKRTSELKNK